MWKLKLPGLAVGLPGLKGLLFRASWFIGRDAGCAAVSMSVFAFAPPRGKVMRARFVGALLLIGSLIKVFKCVRCLNRQRIKPYNKRHSFYAKVQKHPVNKFLTKEYLNGL